MAKPKKNPTTKDLVKFMKKFIFQKEYEPYMKEIVFRLFLYDEVAELKDKIQIVREF